MGQCPLCWLLTNDADYLAAWDRPGSTAETAWLETGPRVVQLMAGGEPPSVPEAPGLIQKGMNFVGAVGRAAVQVVTGRPVLVSEEVYQRRLALCVACEPYYDAASNRCTHRKCGCNVAGSLVAKARWSTEGCPIGRWGPEKE